MSAGSTAATTVRAARRRRVRLLGAALSAGCAIVYFAIALGLIHPVEATPEAGDLFVFGVASGLAFLLGAALLAATDRCPLWVLGAVFQALVIVMYVVVAEKRTPSFEAWGLGLKVAQLAILAVLVYLSVTPAQAQVRTRGARPGAPTVA